MILLQYEMQANWDLNILNEEPVHSLSESNIRERIMDFLNFYGFDDLFCEIRNSGHPCLLCKFTKETYDTDRSIRYLKFNEKNAFYDSLIDRIIAELMLYEREEFTYREIEL